MDALSREVRTVVFWPSAAAGSPASRAAASTGRQEAAAADAARERNPRRETLFEPVGTRFVLTGMACIVLGRARGCQEGNATQSAMTARITLETEGVDYGIMRIIAVRAQPVCLVVSIVYGFVGLAAFIWFDYDSLTQLILPIGFYLPLTYLGVNIHADRAVALNEPVIWAIVSVLAYALSGYITGTILTYSFNFVAGLMGGIDARFVRTIDEQSPTGAEH